MRALVELGRAPDLQQPAKIHHPQPVAKFKGFFLVMRDEDRCDAQVGLDLAQGAAQLHADLGVQSAEGLVEQEHLGPMGDGARQGHALLLSTRKLGGHAAAEAG